jgi:tRNA A-37 threonylcarbamoyl transferase component Bud32
MSCDRAGGRLAERVARCQSEILAGVMPCEPGLQQLASVRIWPIEERSVHEIAALEVVRPPRSAYYFAKATVPGYSGKQDLASESQILAQVGPRIAALNPKTRCPQVMAFFPEEKLLVEEFIQGQSLKALLFDFLPGRADVQAMLKLSGEWLAHFHNQTRQGQANPFEWLGEEIHGRGFADTFRRCSISELYPVAVRLLRHFSKQYSSLCRPLCQVHGEFTPLHIMVQNDALYVIDFGSSHCGFAYEDLARFSTFCDGLLPWRWAIAALRFSIAQQTDSFLKSYAEHAGLVPSSEDDVVTRFARLCAMADQQLSWERQPRNYREKGPLRIRRMWMRRRFASLVRRELSHLERLAQDDLENGAIVPRLSVALGADTQLE